MRRIRSRLGSRRKSLDSPVASAAPELKVAIPPKWSASEREALAQLRAAIKPELQQALPFPEVVGERRLLRFLRGHAYQVDKCADKMRRMLQWRKSAGIDSIRADIMQSRVTGPQMLPKYEEMRRIYPIHLPSRRCVDIRGTMVTIERFAFRVEEALNVLSPEDILRFHFYVMELKVLILERHCDDLDREREERMLAGDISAFPRSGEGWGALSRLIVIRDFKGFQLGAVANTKCRNLIMDIIRTTSDYYPELMEKCFMINVPALFSTAWRIAKTACEKATVEKISINGKNYLADMLKRIDAEQLPHFLGGENTAVSYESLGEDPDVCLPIDGEQTRRLCEQIVATGGGTQFESDVWSPAATEAPAQDVKAEDSGNPVNVGSTEHILRQKQTREVVTFMSFIKWLLVTLQSQVMFVFALGFGSLKLVNNFLIGPFRDMVAATVLVVFAWSLPTAVSKARQPDPQ